MDQEASYIDPVTSVDHRTELSLYTWIEQFDVLIPDWMIPWAQQQPVPSTKELLNHGAALFGPSKATLEFPTGYFKVDIEEDESSSTQIMLKSNLIFIPYDAKDTMETSTSENRHRSISATHPEALVKCVVESDVKGTEAINCDNCFRYEGFYWHDLKKHFTIYKIIDFLEAMKDAEGNSIVLKANYGCFRGDQKLFRLTIKGDPASVIDPRMDRNVFCIVTDVPFIHEHAAVDVENA